ncbi:transcriptional regulator [Streptomyces nodosus]|uniref:transcriptional regulator n=1 Tax=Streptomyces nodosus TaxID=40318 RepID=UPI0034570CEF
MTTVRTPPPTLPVRQRTQIPGNGVSPLLDRLVAERATGVLMRDGGMLHLSGGQLVYAESPATPGLDALLIARGALDEEGWREAIAQAGPLRQVGRFLVDSGRIGQGALELCHLGALYDAAYFVLGPSGAPARFRYGEAHWLGPVRPVPVAAVERETLRRRELLHRIWPDPATDRDPLVRTGLPAGPAVTSRQRAVLERIDGVRTAADISRALGRPAFHTLVDLRRLAAAGLVATRAAVPAPVAPATMPAPLAPAPARATVAAPAAETPVPAAQPAPFADPHITFLKRLRDALEAL